MKRRGVIPVLLIVGILSFAAWVGAEARGQAAQQNPPATGPATPAPGATPAVKRPPQLKTKPEQEAYTAAAANTDAAGLEKAADDFATKFPDSEVRVLLYEQAMRLYQNANNADKTETMGRKVLTLDSDNPEALVTVAEVIAERTRDSDIDKDQRYAEAMTMAKKATETVNTDISIPANTPQAQIDKYKGLLLSNAYSILGTIEFKKDNFVAAQEDLQKSIDVYPSEPDPVVVLRLALALDKQQKYPEALKVANRAVELTQDNTTVGTPARHERDRLQQLTGAAPPATPAQTPPKN
ncbi:MAG TPA: tetratricopeptide repeat protein [Terriglobales bacterium]|jgi:tetratricopeptide (TPR) repeat protein|nr:tetratricopeptide repeat protein [Terriglobales bacterium]